MEKKEIENLLRAIVSVDTKESMKKAIAVEAIETDDPVQHLLEMYGDNGLRYSLNEECFLLYVEDIVKIIDNYEGEFPIEINRSNYTIELAFFAYQITLQDLLLRFGLIEEEFRIF